MHVLKHFLFLSLFIASVTAQRFFCPANMIQLYNGVSCSTDAMCAGLAPGFFCLNGFCCANTGSTGSIYGSACSSTSQCNYLNSDCVNNICVCQPAFDFDGTNCNYGTSATPPVCVNNQVSVVQQPGQTPICLPVAQPGGQCVSSNQCVDNIANRPLTCQGGICNWTTNTIASCRNSGAAIQRINGVVMNCLYQNCGTGYQCEWDAAFNSGQYICCSTTSSGGGGIGSGATPTIGTPKFYLGTSMPLQCFGVNACTFVDFPHCVFSPTYRHRVCCSEPVCR